MRSAYSRRRFRLGPLYELPDDQPIEQHVRGHCPVVYPRREGVWGKGVKKKKGGRWLHEPET
jgi:hypothetical protein